MIRRRFALPAFALSLAACSSTPTQFYTLVPAERAGAAAPHAPFQIEVLSVDVPPQVQVPQLVVRAGDGHVQKLESRRWIAPLGDEIRSALADDLSRRLGAQDVSGLVHGAGLKIYRVSMKVERFDSAPGAYARIDTLWTVHPAEDAKGGITCASDAQESVGAGYDALAEGHQRALDAIAAQIAASIAAMQAGTPKPACPNGS